MLKFMFELFASPLGLPIEPFWEWIILLIVGEIAHELAYWLSPGGKEFGSLIYWISKLFVFIGIWAILYGIIQAIQFVILNWIWFTIGGILILAITIIIIVLFKKKRKKGKIINARD